MARRHDGRHAELAALRRRRADAVLRRAGVAGRGGGAGPAAAAGRAVHGRPEHLRLLRGRGADRLSRRRPAPRRRAAAARVERAGRRPGVQPPRRRQPDERPGDDRHVGHGRDLQPRRRSHHRHPARRSHRPGARPRCCSCRCALDGLFGPAGTAAEADAGRVRLHPARRPADRARAQRGAADDAARRDRLHPDVPGRDRIAEARAGSAGAAAAGGGRRDGGGHRPRDPQPAGVDVRARFRSCGRSCR